MSEAIFAVVVSGLDMSDFLSLLPPLNEIGRSSSYPWPDCDECSIAIAVCDGFILASGRLLELIGEGLALEASRKSAALYLCENPDADQYCTAKFTKRRPAGRVEVSSGDIIDDSMGMFEADSEGNDDKHYGQINTHELLGSFVGRSIPKVEWTHYENQ